MHRVESKVISLKLSNKESKFLAESTFHFKGKFLPDVYGNAVLRTTDIRFPNAEPFVRTLLVVQGGNDGPAHADLHVFSRSDQYICCTRTNSVDTMDTVDYTVDSRYLEFQGTHWNTSRYPYLDISELREWGKQ